MLISILASSRGPWKELLSNCSRCIYLNPFALKNCACHLCIWPPLLTCPLSTPANSLARFKSKSQNTSKHTRPAQPKRSNGPSPTEVLPGSYRVIHGVGREWSYMVNRWYYECHMWSNMVDMWSQWTTHDYVQSVSRNWFVRPEMSMCLKTVQQKRSCDFALGMSRANWIMGHEKSMHRRSQLLH